MPAWRISKKISPGFCEVEGLISKHFIWSEGGTAGGVYQWHSLDDAKAFYSGPWLQGIVERYGNEPRDRILRCLLHHRQ